MIFLPLALAAVGVTYLVYASQANAIRQIAQSTETRLVDIARQRVMLPINLVVADACYLRTPVNFDEFVEAARQLGLYWLLLNEGPPR